MNIPKDKENLYQYFRLYEKTYGREALYKMQSVLMGAYLNKCKKLKKERRSKCHSSNN